MRLSIAIAITAVVIVVLTGCGEDLTVDPGEPGVPTDVDCGAIRSWDSDGDGISDRVEDNNGSNGYADLATGRCDADPSRAIGTPGNGSLQGGLNLPDRNTGYMHFYGSDPVDFDDWGVLPLLRCVEATGRALASRNIPVQVGDLSLRNGGLFPPHAGHRNGTEGDFRYVRTDRAEARLDLRTDPGDYDAAATRELFETLFDRCDIDFILVDSDNLDFTIPGREGRIIHADNHSNHFHIRIN